MEGLNIKTQEKKSIIRENRHYWTGRAAGYSEVNRQELSTDQHTVWKRELCSRIRKAFPGRKPSEIRILEVGTGPGFFAILLAEEGYKVTAVDLTPAMLKEAKANAGSLAESICFMEMNAEELSFADSQFDVLVTRNLTWNLPHPDKAYMEWHRVLKAGGLLLNYDANWYHYLFDEEARAGYNADRENTARQGYTDQNIGANFDIMEDIARRVPLSRVDRPHWDEEVLTDLGFQTRTLPDVWKTVWSEEEKVNYASTPQFLVTGIRQ